MEDQLLDATIAPQGGAVSKAFSYQYDGAGNRTLEQIDSAGTSFSATAAAYNNVNQLTARSPGPVLFKGTINEPGTVTVNGQAAKMTQDPNSGSNGRIFTTSVPLSAGQNTVPIVAMALTGLTPPVTTTKTYNLTVIDPGSRTYSYDANGNRTNYTAVTPLSGVQVTYEFDAEDRLVAVNTNAPSAPALRSEFTYDGFSRWVKIVEKNNGTVTITKQFIWCGKQLCEERDGNNNVTKRFYAEGEQIGETSYYFTKDHLGNIREMTGPRGAILARYDYDPYGRRTKVSGTMDADFGFTGHYYHAPSGLH